jgi:ABC-type transporter Mla MlaB component
MCPQQMGWAWIVLLSYVAWAVEDGSSQRGPAMLRITWIDPDGTGSNRTLKLEGKLLGPWVDELNRTCEEFEIRPGCLCLNLAAVTFVDAAGIQLLNGLIQRGATIAERSAFIEEVLNDSRS